ncbi:DUF2188 domain-containing protein [Salinibacter altiplanensis]|uniref:DUF2188 domain-containing protein n=1 Tax=Salinibacter altiplanensis TaxID=1803181 RepID=UPI000C9F6DD1|nr:DUF2188 domain-containing protein [Salinibacter altiplanensis]
MSKDRKNQHVVQREDGWAVRGEENSQDTSRHKTQSDAIDEARSIAQNQESEMIIHSREGEIRERSSYGDDPHPPDG